MLPAAAGVTPSGGGVEADVLRGAVQRAGVDAALAYDLVDGAHWARGATYKASADAGGSSYIPFLGLDAPRNFPVHFELVAAERGGVALPIADEAVVLFGIGSRDRSAPHTLVATLLPLHATGFFIGSRDAAFVQGAGGSSGTLCIGGAIGRFGLFHSGSGGRGVFALDPQAIAQPSGAVSALAGEVWRFQAWHRDAVGGTATSNFTNVVAIPFL